MDKQTPKIFKVSGYLLDCKTGAGIPAFQRKYGKSSSGGSGFRIARAVFRYLRMRRQ